MGVWNSHTSVGNILGAVIPALFVETAWGWSFVVPGIIIGSLGVIVFFFLVPGKSGVINYGFNEQNTCMFFHTLWLTFLLYQFFHK